MAILNFSDVLDNAGIDPKRVKLIRHSMNDKEFSKCCKANMVLEYTRVQNSTFSNGYDYWCVFISGEKTTARFFACYRVNGCVPDTQAVKPDGFPLEDWFQGQRMFYDLEPVELLKEYEGRLLIEWGKGTLAWAQKGTNEKPIVAIESAHQKPFVGFENLILSFDELKAVVEPNEADYKLWRAAMSSVNAVYLIVDTKTGDRYVGSTYGYDGLLGRWSVYVATGGHGNNKGMIQHLRSADHSCHDLQFSVLQVLPKSLPDNQIIDTETLWKKKLQTYEPFGMNQN